MSTNPTAGRSERSAGRLLRAAVVAASVSLAACGQASAPSQSVSRAQAGHPSETPDARLGGFPSPPTGNLPLDVSARLQAIVDAAPDMHDVPGIAAAVIAAGAGTWVGAAGTADGDASLDPAAQFGIGSVTKTVIAAEVLHLVEAGSIDLDRPIADYFTGEDIPTNGATVREVLGMRSGIKEATGDPRAICADLAASFSLRDMTGVLSDESLFRPGTQFRYTNANYVLAGLLIEKVTGTTVAKALRSGVLSEPGLERLVYQDEEPPSPPIAAPFVVLDPSDPVPGPSELLELGGGYLPSRCLAATAGPAGGMAADAMSLARWGYLLYGGWVLGEAALADMTAFQDGYGLAAHDHESQFGVAAVGHEGTVPGYVAQLLAFPEEGIAIAVLVNTNGVAEEALTSLAGHLREVLDPQGP
jgi:D-alanyl-D-alanine carboxypeptidase